MVSTIQITDSAFVNNGECISVVVNKTMNPSEALLVILTLKHSSFYGNAVSGEGSCVSFSESSDDKHSLSAKITLDNVTFSDNKFSSKGLVFLDMENGNQDFNLQKVKFIKNSALSDRTFFASDGHSEILVLSNTVNIFINESNFSSTNARSFMVNAFNIAMQIFNSSFEGNKCEGNGGVMLLKGTDLCQVNVSNSSFVKTSASQGGAFDIDCVEVKLSLLESIFSHNRATDGDGGAVLVTGPRAPVRFFNSSSTSRLAENEVIGEKYGGALFVSSGLPPICRSTFQASHLDVAMFLTVERCRFIGCRASDGGALSVSHVTFDPLQLVIKHSDFIFNHAKSGGGAVAVSCDLCYPEVMRDGCLRGNTGIFETSIENSTFSRNEADMGSALDLISGVITLDKVIMDSNSAFVSATVLIGHVCKLKISQSRLINNRAATVSVSGIGIQGVIRAEVTDSIFDGNYCGTETNPILSGGALAVMISHSACSAFISIINSTFNNCSASYGGAISLFSGKPVNLTIRSSRFTKNHSIKGGGALWLTLTEDTKNPAKCKADYRPSWHYKSHVIFEDTKFEGNIAAEVGGALYITNGNRALSRSHFVDNFASVGSHIYAVDGSASLNTQNSSLVKP